MYYSNGNYEAFTDARKPKDADKKSAYVIGGGRGGWEMENHFECLWDMYRSIPSLEIPGASYLDEYAWLDKDDPNSSNCRLIHH